VTPDVVVAEYESRGEASADRQALHDAGVAAWLEEAQDSGPVLLVVPAEAADQARAVLEEVQGEWGPASHSGRPLWISVVAALVAAGLIWAAVPRFLWPWLLFGGLVAFLLWRAAGPRRP
jgi:hypothetical protein